MKTRKVTSRASSRALNARTSDDQTSGRRSAVKNSAPKKAKVSGKSVSVKSSLTKSASAKNLNSKIMSTKMSAAKSSTAKGSSKNGAVAKVSSKSALASKSLASKAVASKSSVVKKNGVAKNGVTKNGVAKHLAPVNPISGNIVTKQPVGKSPVKPFVAAKGVAAPVVAKVATKAVINFQVGDKVVYPAHGVGVIDDIQTRKISTAEQSFYMLTVVETGMKIMIPVGQVDTVGLRKVVDSKTIDKVYDILRDRNVVTDTQTWNRRYREYTQKIKTGSVFEIASVIRDLIVLKGDKELSFGERKMLDTAQGLLVKEISIAKARSEDMVRAELMEMFQAI